MRRIRSTLCEFFISFGRSEQKLEALRNSHPPDEESSYTLKLEVVDESIILWDRLWEKREESWSVSEYARH